MRTLMLLLMGSIAMFTTTCGIIDSQKFPEYTDHWTEYQLYMGKGAGSEEVDDEWDHFLADTGNPRPCSIF